MGKYLLDTNVFLKDPLVLEGFNQGDQLYVSLGVLRELDQKKYGTDTINYNSRLALRNLSPLIELDDINTGYQIGGDGAVINVITLDDPMKYNYADPELLEILSLNRPKNLTLLSDDIGLLMQAKSLDYQVKRYEGSGLHRKRDLNALLGLSPSISLPHELVSQIRKDSYGCISKSNYRLPGGIFENSYLFIPGQKMLVRYSEIGKDHSFTLIKNRALLEKKRGISGIVPKNKEQEAWMDLCMDVDRELVAGLGVSGTGKTLLAMACGFHLVKHKKFSRVMIIRPVSEVGDSLGFLPGDLSDKMGPYFRAIQDNAEVIFKKQGNLGDAMRADMDENHLEHMMEQRTLVYDTPNFHRGRSIGRTYMILDEAQNLKQDQIKTIITRAGAGTKVVMLGDPYQIDLPFLDENSNGLVRATKAFLGQSTFGATVLKKPARSHLSGLAAKLL
jgi:PhoH-like ATPase